MIMRRIHVTLIAQIALAWFVARENAVAQSPATAPSGTRDAALQSILKDTILPGYQDLAAKCHDLSDALESGLTNSSTEHLDLCRKAWIATALSARRIQWLQNGPIADREYLSSFYFSKVMPERIDSVLTSSRAIDPAYIAEFGANARGLFAVEHLIFAAHNAPNVPADSAAAPSTRRVQYALLLARDLEAKSKDLLSDWSVAGDKAAAGRFLAGGQQSLGSVVNQLAQFLEKVAEDRINFILLLPQPVSKQFARIEGSASGSTQLSALAMLQSAQSVYQRGLEGCVRHVNAPVADRVRGQFETAVAALQNIAAPLETAATGNRPALQNAYEKTRALEVAFKVDVASALGVTLTFTSGDGD